MQKMQHKTFKQTAHKIQVMSDSSTAHGEAAHIQRSGLRKHTSIRVDSGLWEAFNKACIFDGQRTCEVLELIMLGYTTGILAKKDHQVSNGAQSTTINVTANLLKEIKRERRYAHEDVCEEGYNYYQADPGIWKRENGELNSNGHVIGCECLLCRKRKP